MNEQPLIQLSRVHRTFSSGDQTIHALNDVSLTIWPGEFVAIMGQSGSGKSTLMNILGCLDQATSGSYLIRGTPVQGMGKDQLAELRRQTFGFIFQRYNLINNASASENVEIPALYAGTERQQRHERALELLGQLGLENRVEHLPAQLSGGQQQRVAIARALVNRPAAILADEPTGALDSQSGKEVMDLLTELNRRGQTVILITHDAQVAAHADRIIRIQDGKITEDNGPQQIFRARLQTTADQSSGAHASVMDTLEALKTARRSLFANLFRTCLTLLGIVIGVAAVIIMLAVGNGSKQRVLQQIQSMGTNIVFIRPGAPGMRPSGDIVTLKHTDARELEHLPNIKAVVPERSGQKTVRFGNRDYTTSISGVGSAFPQARDWEIASGSFFSERDIESYAPVVVLGRTVLEALFPDGSDPVGKFILIGTIPFEVIGTMTPKGAAPWGGDQDNTVFVPVSTALVRLFGGSYLNSITLKVIDVSQVTETEAMIQKALTDLHGKEDFQIRNSSSFIEMASSTQNTLTALLGAVAAISLLVGGIGVMNIMLVSVTERTREIGIRMATGARMRDIQLQFLTEAAMVCTLGGLAGLAIGFSGGGLLSLFGIDVLFSPAPALLAFSCAVGTGLLFGYMPARKAAALDPVKALSVE